LNGPCERARDSCRAQRRHGGRSACRDRCARAACASCHRPLHGRSRSRAAPGQSIRIARGASLAVWRASRMRVSPGVTTCRSHARARLRTRSVQDPSTEAGRATGSVRPQAVSRKCAAQRTSDVLERRRVFQYGLTARTNAFTSCHGFRDAVTLTVDCAVRNEYVHRVGPQRNFPDLTL